MNQTNKSQDTLHHAVSIHNNAPLLVKNIGKGDMVIIDVQNPEHICHDPFRILY